MNKMKKLFVLVLIVTMVSVGLVGCKKHEHPTGDKEHPTEETSSDHPTEKSSEHPTEHPE